MSFQTWWFYFGSAFLVCALPGPNMLHVMVRSARMGFSRSIPAMAGCHVAMELMLAASAVGLGAILMAFPYLFDTIRYAGAGYLLYVGVRSWCSGGDRLDSLSQAGQCAQLSPLRLFGGGLLVGLTNPKAILFATAFLPQFIEPAEPKAPQLAILVLTFAMTEVFWYILYAAGGRRLARYLRRPVYRRLFDRVTGGLFVSFGLALTRAQM